MFSLDCFPAVRLYFRQVPMGCFPRASPCGGVQLSLVVAKVRLCYRYFQQILYLPGTVPYT